MPNSTPTHGLVFPVGGDQPIVHSDIERLANSADAALTRELPFKGGLSSSDDLAGFTQRGRWEVLSGIQADNLGLPASAKGYFESIPNRNGGRDLQVFITSSSRPMRYARTWLTSGWTAWENVGTASLIPLSSSDNMDSLVPGRSYYPASGQVAEALGLPSTIGAGQRGILKVHGLSSDTRDTSVRLLEWTVLSATPGFFTRSKISGEWRDWVRLDIGGIDTESLGRGLPGQVNLWGSSTPAGIHTSLVEALQPYGVQVHHHARGGQWASQTAANVGSRTITIPVVGGTIPASGSVTLDTANSILDGVDLYLAPEGGKLLGWLGGVHGELVGTGDTFTNRGATFTRSHPGSAVTVSAPEWVPDTRTGAHLNIYNSSKNDLNVGQTTAHLDRAKTHLDQAVALWQSRGQDFLILTHFVNNGTPASDAGRTQINAYNAYVRATYPNNMVDMGLLVTQTEMWEWTGITPTSGDTTQQALGNMPPSIQGSGNHLNAAGNQYFSHKIAEWMLDRQYIGEGRVPFASLNQLTELSPGIYEIGAH